MAGEPTRSRCQYLPPRDARPVLEAGSSKQGSRSAAPAAMNARAHQRDAATRPRRSVLDAYALHAPKQDPEPNSNASGIRRPSTRQPTPTDSDDSSDSDIFVDDSESDCPRRIKAVSGKKRKRSASPMRGGEERRERKALKTTVGRDGKVKEAGDRKPKEEASGFMVRSGSMMRNILRDTARRATRMPPRSQWKKTHVSGQQRLVRRAGLNDMGPDAGGYVAE